jgi:hypothetical protein
MTVYDTSCLRSVVKNTSGLAMYFPVLPPHGVYLADDEEVSFLGDVRELVRRNRSSTMNPKAFEKLLADGKLQIISTPNPILQDLTTDAVQMVVADNGSLALADPCWTVSVGP